MRHFVLIFILVAAGCATSAPQPSKSWVYKGHCVKAQIGGEDLLPTCGDSVITLEYSSGLSGIAFFLGSDRELVFLSPNDPKIHQVNSSYFESSTTLSVLKLSMLSKSGEYTYDMVVVGCDHTRETPVPRFIECIGQADQHPVFFAFETDGTAPIAGEDSGK